MTEIKITTDPATSATLYNGDLKVIVPAADLAVVSNRCRLSSRISIYSCERGDRRAAFAIHRAGVKRRSIQVPVSHPPTFCLALLAASAAGARELETLRDFWSVGAEGFLPGTTLISAADSSDAAAATVHAALFDAVAGIYGPSAARMLTLQKQYTAFRTVHDQLQNAFDTVEGFLARAQLPPTWLGFACEPTEATIGPPSSGPPYHITQLLPLASQG